jgi:citrate lyase gamma subunit
MKGILEKNKIFKKYFGRQINKRVSKVVNALQLRSNESEILKSIVS